MTEKDVEKLLKKYHAGECSEEELRFIHEWYRDLESTLPDSDTLNDSDQVQQEIWQRLQHTVPLQHKVKSYKRSLYLRVAASVALLLTLGTGYYIFKQKDDRLLDASIAQQDIVAGKNKAILTLADGRQIILDDNDTGVLANQTGVQISKNSKGQLVYVLSNPENSVQENQEPTYNTISTPKGGQYQLILPDGSEVFLNASSSVRFATAFTKDRRVDLTGEAYFDVKKDKAHPFTVVSEGQEVKVLGTQFNVSSYAGELTKTTLAEGSVEILATNVGSAQRPQPKILKPGQQATLLSPTKDGQLQKDSREILTLKQVNADDVIAWKDGLFVFSNTSLKDVFRQLSRWYDVDVDYAAIPNIAYEGEIPREVNLRQVLDLIEATSQIKFEIAERRIVRK